jgi:hypothetical protein
MGALERLVRLALVPLDAITRFLSAGPGMVLAFLALGGVAFWWRHLLLRQKRVEAALRVLEALDRVREEYQAARDGQRVNAAGTPGTAGAQKYREAQMVATREEYQRGLERLFAARDTLRAAQASAVAHWGLGARAPLDRVYKIVDTLGAFSGYYWPKAVFWGKRVDHGVGNTDAPCPQPGMLLGHAGDDTGRFMDEAIRDAEHSYREAVHRK